MARDAGVVCFPAREISVAKLAQLFPDASPVRIPVQVTTLRDGAEKLKESTLIEFGTPMEILFASTLPLEFDDKVRVKNSDGSLEAEASVVAVQYHDGRKAVAARFLAEVGNWIIKR
ncbi:MAG: hypothetical protein WBC04_16415 [Candidatus Acidiferrales bacterium]